MTTLDARPLPMWACGRASSTQLKTEVRPIGAGLAAHFVSEVLGYLTAGAAARHLP